MSPPGYVDQIETIMEALGGKRTLATCGLADLRSRRQRRNQTLGKTFNEPMLSKAPRRSTARFESRMMTPSPPSRRWRALRNPLTINDRYSIVPLD